MSTQKIYVREQKFKNNNPPIVLISALVIVAILIGAIYLIDIPKKSIVVTFQGQKLEVPANTTPEDLLSKTTTNTREYYGDLIDVTGEVLEKGKGKAPTFIVYGEPVAGDSTLSTGETVFVETGAHVTEDVTTVKSDVRPGYTRKGGGSIPTLVSPGKSGVAEIVTGKMSNKVVKKGISVAPIKASMDFKQYRNDADKVIALTFDDGPRAGNTQNIVHALQDNGVTATFFMLGTSVKRDPALARMVTDAGNEVGIHSYSHRLMTKQSAKQIEKEIRNSTDTIREATGKTPVWIRPPYGAVDGLVYTTLSENKLHVALWSIDTYDWKKPGVATIVKRAINGFPGAVILMHDGGGNRDQTAKALPNIIKHYKDAGYRFVTLSEYQALIDEAEKK